MKLQVHLCESLKRPIYELKFFFFEINLGLFGEPKEEKWDSLKNLFNIVQPEVLDYQELGPQK